MKRETMHFNYLDDPYLTMIQGIPKKLEESFSNYQKAGQLPIDGYKVTNAILLRLKAYYSSQKEIKDFLGKRSMGAEGANFFEETILFYVKALNETHKLGLEVKGQKKLEKLKPDISIWTGDSLLAFVECKTQFGWDRHEWENRFRERERKLKVPGFLVVMTQENWPDCSKNPQLGEKYFVLYDKWPTKLDVNILTPIEGLLKKILQMTAT